MLESTRYYDVPLSNFAFNFNLRHYNSVDDQDVINVLKINPNAISYMGAAYAKAHPDTVKSGAVSGDTAKGINDSLLDATRPDDMDAVSVGTTSTYTPYIPPIYPLNAR